MDGKNTSTKNVILISGPFIGVVRDVYDVINVDTRNGPVSLYLENINQSNLLYASRSVYINDTGNNLSVNNLTLLGSLGDIVNNLPSVVVSNDGANLKCYVANVNEWTVTGLPSTQIATGDKNFVYVQPTPSNSWVINHNLNKYCSVTVVDSAKTEIIGDLQYIDLNTLILTFVGTFSGQAYCN